MKLTEQDASLKRCPAAFAAAHGVNFSGATTYECIGDVPITGQFKDRVHAPLNCIGSQCMAWRWEQTDDLFRKRDKDRGDPIKGYCGKAGKP
jgi:hypothetical protein